MYPISPAEPSAGSHGFFFLGNHFALDFLNTRPKLDGNLVELLNDFPSILRWFQASALLTPQEAASLLKHSESLTHKTHHALLAFRESLRHAVELWEHAKPIPRDFTSQLNDLLSQHPVKFR